MKVTEEQFINSVKAVGPKVRKLQKYIKATYDIDITTSPIEDRIKRLRAKGKLPLQSGNLVEPGQLLISTSTYHYGDKDTGRPAQWIKADAEKVNAANAYKEIIDSITNDLGKHAKPIPAPQGLVLDKDITVFYPLPDLHFGLLVSAEESNHNYNYDMKIATRWVMGAMEHLVDTAPRAKYAVITDLGDYLHANDNSNRTVSGHVLDTDGRHAKIIQASFDVTRRLIDKALMKHDMVYFYSVAGNHSENSSIYLKAFLAAWYKDEPRVQVITAHKAQQYHIFGKNIIGFTHGHELRPERCSEVLVADNKDEFSASEYRYYHFGHFHTNKQVEGPLVNVEIHKNIIPRDSWAESMGFRGHIGEAKAIYYHAEYGEIGRSRFNIRMLEDKENK